MGLNSPLKNTSTDRDERCLKSTCQNGRLKIREETEDRLLHVIRYVMVIFL